MAKHIVVKGEQLKKRYFSALKVHHRLQIIMLITLFGLIINPDIVVAQGAEINPRMDSKDDGGVTANPGDTVTYTLRYENTGLNDASGVVLIETVPTNTTFNPGASTSVTRTTMLGVFAHCPLDFYRETAGLPLQSLLSLSIIRSLPM